MVHLSNCLHQGIELSNHVRNSHFRMVHLIGLLLELNQIQQDQDKYTLQQMTLL